MLGMRGEKGPAVNGLEPLVGIFGVVGAARMVGAASARKTFNAG
jgi:hypothetical protein